MAGYPEKPRGCTAPGSSRSRSPACWPWACPLPEPPRSDWATWDAPRASLGTDVRTFSVTKDKTANRLLVAVMFPSEATLGAGVGLTKYSVVVKDAKGKVLVAETVPAGIGTATAFVVVPSGTVGPYTVTVTGDQSASDPDTLDSDSALGDTITLEVVQAVRR